MFVLKTLSGAEGSRTPVRKPIRQNFSHYSRSIGFPLSHAGRQAKRLGSFIRSVQPSKLWADSASQFMTPHTGGCEQPPERRAAIRLQEQLCCLRLYLVSVFIRSHGLRMAILVSRSPSKPLQPLLRRQPLISFLFPVVPDVLHVVVILEHVELYPHVLDTVLANELDASVSLGFIIVQP